MYKNTSIKLTLALSISGEIHIIVFFLIFLFSLNMDLEMTRRVKKAKMETL